jgi:hypothetical protein
MESSNEQIDYGEVVGRDFLDKLLLAIIDAHPGQSTSRVSDVKRREDRRRQALEALLGQSHAEGRPRNSDETILKWIGNEHYKDRARRDMAKFKGEFEPKVRSVHQLVKYAVKHFGLPDNAGERLRKKLRGEGTKRWLELAVLHDDVPEQLDRNLLKSVQDVLARRGIAMDLRNVER